MAPQLHVAISCMVINFFSMLWIIYQCIYFVNNTSYQQHQAFKIRGKNMFLLTAFVLILNFIFRPIVVALSVMDIIVIDSIWRLVIDLAQMSLYAIIEFRCWITYFNLNTSTAIVDRQWKQYLNQNQTTSDFFMRNQKYFARSLYVGIFFSFHGILCVIICDLVEENLGFYPHRIICHFFTANILFFLLFLHRMYTLLFGVKHTYSHDMLSINKELNMITLIMTITAICDCALGIWYHSMSSMFYFVYQTILILMLSIIIFYLPQHTIIKLIKIEETIKIQNKKNSATLKHVFMDSDLYHSFIRFMVEEWSAENLLFVSQWMQLQKIIADSKINVKTNRNYTCTESFKCNVLTIPSDILLYSGNMLEASRGIYDKFVKTSDILQINISYSARNKLNEFFTKHNEITRIFGVRHPTGNSVESNDRTTTVVVDDNNGNQNTNMVKYVLFMQQIQDNEISIEVIQEMIDAFGDAVRDCWDNTNDSFQRFQSTINYKINSSYFKLPEVKK
eukprot:331950_1